MNDKVARKVSGHVKWFDSTKGFGFVVAEGEPRDILLHANVLRNFGQGSVADGAGVTLIVQDTARGAQAVEVLEITLPERPDTAPQGDLQDLTDLDLSEVEMVAARVKWFDRGKGFGFANVWGKPEDVFIHAEVLRRSGLAELQAGEAVALRVIEGRRGLMAGQVLAWDASVAEQGS
ncbi:cold-shock protein [Frigidibacter sp. ROC022]|uniref:cold-shock protein n=1 Tax=Frigidibacter sp. ROC022 TaxID=2971796 RepID=UPI00215B0448|nr:cold shock protein [Frigidibacter sp. ROC022]MCR8725575.1 cold shock domain-containing protein [Frigidibacter sp. ROC022]